MCTGYRLTNIQIEKMGLAWMSIKNIMCTCGTNT